MASTYHPLPHSEQSTSARPSLATALDHLLGRIPRLVRFGFIGGTCALLQLVFLDLLVQANLELHLANAVAFLLSTQLNFALSSLITWRDRLAPHERPALLARRLAGYNGLALLSLAINQAVFSLAALTIHYLAAATLGILAGMLLTYTISGRIIFRHLARTGMAATPPSPTREPSNLRTVPRKL
jgi:putative flippase GtrA